ncbi:MAG: NB-ARC domain-containing protein [Calothrix sp. MO_167.B12]|nr:NB-ARC domain-containing protein [Calothrix sp. MO_167.B12]
MPKKTYGPQVKKRVKRLLEALLCFVDGEFEDYGFDIKHNNWIEEDSKKPKLIIQTTLVALEWLTAKDKYPEKLTKPQIREALKLLDKDNDDSLLKILEDNRATKRGSGNWHFTLKLWSKDKEQNLKRFDEVWENNRPSKSKALEANYQQDDGIATVTRPKIDIFQAPPLPTYYVDRPEYTQDLKNRLLTNSSDVRTLVVTAIHGLGSVGKSTIATALAHDEEVQAHFCDGILWATLGQQPNLLSLLSGWVQSLGDYNFKATSVEATCTQLRTLLYDKAVLLVVDDAWNTQDAQAFNVGGARCQVLVTTREAGIAQVLGASTYSLDVMTPSQSMELLTKKIGRKFTDTEIQEAETLTKAIGYLPLALELAAAQVTDGTPWTVIVQDMQQEVARLKTLDNKSARDATDEVSLKRLSLTASLNLSVQRLSDDTRENFIWLGILPEDATITQKMAATLWDMDDERDAGDELRYLKNKALLLPGVPLADGTPTYRLHDLFHDLARNLLTAPPKPKPKGNLPGLGITLPAAHATFLENYRNLTDKNLWHTLPNDGYIHQHLVWHLKKAEKVEEIHQLLAEESATGGNGWFEACEKLGQTANFITDVTRAWQLAEVDWTETTTPQAIGLQCRYALITASLNSLAANLSVEMLIALVLKNVWTPEQGIAYALQNPNPEQKAHLLKKLANYLPPHLKQLVLSKALAAVKEIRGEEKRADVLRSLADILLPELLPEALAAARQIQDERHCAKALSSLASILPPELLPEALAAARKIPSREYRAGVLSVLADKLPELLPEALATVREIRDEWRRCDPLRSLGSCVLSVLKC